MSSIEFRTGEIGPGGTLTLDDPGPYLVAGTPVEPVFDRALFQRALDELAAHSEDTAFVIETLPRTFGRVELDQVLALLRSHQVTRPSALLTTAHEPWELIQIGNCGSPIETPEGWLVLTHGVGPMRVYSMGAVLLDLHDPCRVIGRLPRPWLTPTGAERDGYVPNVVYSCGALVHDDTLVVPYGSSDAAVGIAYVALPELLAALRAN